MNMSLLSMAITLTILFTQLDAAQAAPYRLLRNNNQIALYDPATQKKNTIFQLDAPYTSRCAAASIMKKGAEDAVVVLIEHSPRRKEVVLTDLQGTHKKLLLSFEDKIATSNSLCANAQGDKLLISTKVSAVLCDLKQQKTCSVYQGENISDARFDAQDEQEVVIVDGQKQITLTLSQ